MTLRIPIVVTNFAGGKEFQSSEIGRRQGYSSLGEVWREVSGTDGGLLLAQELTSDLGGLPIRLSGLEDQIGPNAVSTFVARMSRAWYPAGAKWARASSDAEDSRSEGLGLVASGHGCDLEPWGLLDGLHGDPSLSRVIDLPVFEFDHTKGDGSGWIEANTSEGRLRFRPSYYQGGRDTDPRIAQASVARVEHPVWGTDRFVLINLHLSTLTSERRGEDEMGPRLKSRQASWLRSQQLDVVSRFVSEVRESSDLPVIVAGDFNAEPDWPEMQTFFHQTGLRPAFDPGRCWRCRTRVEHPDRWFPSDTKTKVTAPAPAVVDHSAFCTNENCRMPLFTHKNTLQLVDNILVHPHMRLFGRPVRISEEKIDLGRSYTDHAVISAVLNIAAPSETQPPTGAMK